VKLKLTLPMPVSINKLYINEYQWNAKTRQRTPTGRRILSQEGRTVKAQIQDQARMQLRDQDWDFDKTKEIYVYQDAVFYFARRGTDDNNQYKLLNDSLEGIVYENDSRVLVRTQRIVYDPHNPRIEIQIYPVEFKGIFINQEAQDNFTKRCEEECGRYRKGCCSILKDCINGTLRKELSGIDESVCSGFKLKK
jgi:hypothetical protein